MSPRPIDIENLKEAAKSYTAEQYAEKTNRSWASVRNLASKYNIQFRRANPERDDAKLRELVVDAYNRGLTRTAARNEIQVCYYVIQRHWPVAATLGKPSNYGAEKDPTNPDNWPDYSTENVIFKPKKTSCLDWRKERA